MKRLKKKKLKRLCRQRLKKKRKILRILRMELEEMKSVAAEVNLVKMVESHQTVAAINSMDEATRTPPTIEINLVETETISLVEEREEVGVVNQGTRGKVGRGRLVGVGRTTGTRATKSTSQTTQLETTELFLSMVSTTNLSRVLGTICCSNKYKTTSIT